MWHKEQKNTQQVHSPLEDKIREKCLKLYRLCHKKQQVDACEAVRNERRQVRYR